MHRVMINVFTQEDAGSVLLLAYAHAMAKMAKGGVHTVYCTDENANKKTHDLIQTMKLATAQDIQLPDKRFILFSNLPVDQKTVDELLQYDGVRVFYEGRTWRWLRQLAAPFLFFYRKGERRERAIDALSCLFIWYEKRPVKRLFDRVKQI